MAYAPPNKGTLRAAVARDLRDPEFRTFTTQEVGDLINLAIVEVGRIYPKERVADITVTQNGQSAFLCDAASIFRVEILEEDKQPQGIPSNSSVDDGQSGWDMHAGRLYLPFGVSYLLVQGKHSLRVWGYWPRELMYGDADVFDGDAEAEFGVRTVAALNGYQRLQNDRLLFQQWLTNTGNTDVSPNQLAQTADLYQTQWREMRQRLRTIQRV